MKTEISAAVSSTITADAYAMEFDSEGTAHLMRVLSNMYSDAPLAVLREYSANAYDSHIAAGNDAPIEVSLPDEWNPNLVITDYGVGLSEDEIISVYSRYGKSTKRDTNDQVGAFGIGAKSAFTIGNQFVVTGTKNGVRTVALFAINEQGIPTVSILSTKDVAEPNGVKVSISVENVDAIREAAKRLFATWEPGTVLVDGVQPESVYDSALKISDNLYATPGFKGIVLVMGGIGYPASSSMLWNIYYKVPAKCKKIINNVNEGKYSIIAKVPTGSVDITPSREDLRDTPRTLEVLKQVLVDTQDNINLRLSQLIESAPTKTHAAVVLFENKDFLSGEETVVEYKGKKLSNRITVPYPYFYLRSTRVGTKAATSDDHIRMHLGTNLSKFLVITGCDAKQAGSVKRTAKKYLQSDKSDVHEGIICVPDAAGEVEWFSWGGNSPVATTTLEEYRELVKTIPSESDGTPRTETTYTVYERHSIYSKEMLPRDIKKHTGRIFYDNGRGIVNTILGKEVVRDTDWFISLSGRQTSEALVRRIPNAIYLRDAVRERAQQIVNNMTDADRASVDFERSYQYDFMSQVMVEAGDNTLFHNNVVVYAEAKSKVSANEDEVNRMREAEHRLGIPRRNNEEKWAVIEETITKYPLLRSIFDHPYRCKDASLELIKHAASYVTSVKV